MQSQDQDRAVKQTWDVIQAIWGDKPDPICIELLRDLNLSAINKGYWGVYLDSLLARGAARKVVAEIRMVIAHHRQLDWAEVAWQRLPTAWNMLGWRGFTWQAEDGVGVLLTQLADRPQVTMRSLLIY